MASVKVKRCDICNKIYEINNPYFTSGRNKLFILGLKSSSNGVVTEYNDVCPHCSTNLGAILQNLIAQRVRSELEEVEDE